MVKALLIFVFFIGSIECFAAPSISDLISNLHGRGKGTVKPLEDCDIFPYGEFQGSKRIMYSFNYRQERLYYGGPNDELWSFDESISTLYWGKGFEFIFEPVTFKLLMFRIIAEDGSVYDSCDILN